MGRWTEPRRIAYKREWYADTFDYDGPACYELGTGGPCGGNIQWHYVGETSNERQRISAYARNGAHLQKIIGWHLDQGWHLYYRSIACSTKKEARQMQDKRLSQYEFDWNDKLNQK